MAIGHAQLLGMKKLLASSVAVHLADPVIFMLGFGFGLGALIGDVEGLSYLQFVAAGMVAYGTMNSASFEALYSAFTRMHVQRTWESILNAPMNLDDILLGEWLWAAIKGLMAGVAMLVVLTVLGLASWPLSFWRYLVYLSRLWLFPVLRWRLTPLRAAMIFFLIISRFLLRR